MHDAKITRLVALFTHIHAPHHEHELRKVHTTYLVSAWWFPLPFLESFLHEIWKVLTTKKGE
jgi:hypothetical protein